MFTQGSRMWKERVNFCGAPPQLDLDIYRLHSVRFICFAINNRLVRSQRSPRAVLEDAREE